MSEEAIIRCLRIEQVARPASGSERRNCVVCGAEVWFDVSLVDEVHEQMPDSEIVLRGRECEGDDEDEAEVRFTTGQVRRLRAEGASDEEIAELFAIAKVAGAAGDLHATRLLIETFPDSTQGRAFAVALDETRIYVAMTS